MTHSIAQAHELYMPEPQQMIKNVEPTVENLKVAGAQ